MAGPARSRAMLRRTARAVVHGVARALPPKARERYWQFVIAARGKQIRAVKSQRRATSLASPFPKRFTVSPTPKPIASNWPEPPIPLEGNDPIVHATGANVYEIGSGAVRYDVELFEQLNNEYKSKPIVPAPRTYEPSTLLEAAKSRVRWVHEMIDLADKRVLEIGCSRGLEVWLVGNHLNSDSYGVDVLEREIWRKLEGPRVHYRCVDITQERAFPVEHFDRILSHTVWEHVVHPYKALQETYRMMKPGGLQWLRANLHRGPQASHLYRDIYFPWPHLLFSDDVIKDWYASKGKTPKAPAWVNTLTWTQYERYIEMAGFKIESLSFTETPLDEEFYKRFDEVLGRYPKWDLTKDFFTVILRKP